MNQSFSSPPLATIRPAAASLRSGAISSRQLVEACLARIDQLDGQVHAWVSVDHSGARAAADKLDDELRRGQPRSLLHGIPIAIKDIYDVAGWPTLAGSPLRAGHVAQSDSVVVARLRAAGAVILGKTVTTQFASFDPPVTCNPWNPARTPGGSSSGSAAAAALEMCLAAIGSQTGGSITRPAAYCGVAGCKPTFGRVSVGGVIPLSFHMDHPGPIARTVDDLAIVLSVIAGYEPSDPFSCDVPVPDFTAQAPQGNRPRLRVMTGFFAEAASADVLRVTRAAIEQLRSAGADVEEVLPPASFADVIVNHRRIMAVEAATYHRENFPSRRDQFGPQIGTLLDEGLHTSALDYAAAHWHRWQFTHDLEKLLDGCDALVTPAATTTAPTPETTGDPRFNAPTSYAGVPTVCFPSGLGVDGLPVGLQLIGRRWSEQSLLATAGWCERQIGFALRPPLLADAPSAG